MKAAFKAGVIEPVRTAVINPIKESYQSAKARVRNVFKSNTPITAQVAEPTTGEPQAEVVGAPAQEPTRESPVERKNEEPVDDESAKLEIPADLNAQKHQQSAPRQQAKPTLPSDVKNAETALIDAGIIERLLPAQREAIDEMSKGVSIELATSQGKSLAADITTGIELAKHESAGIVDYVVTSGELALQVAQSGGVGKTRNPKIAQTLGYEKILAQPLVEEAQRGNYEPFERVLSGAAGPVQLIYDVDSYGHFGRLIKQPSQSEGKAAGGVHERIRNLLADRVKLTIFDEVDGILTQQSRYVEGDGGGIKPMKPQAAVIRESVKIFNELKDVPALPTDRYAQELAGNPELLAIGVEPGHGKIIKSPALLKQLQAKGYDIGMVDDVLKAQRGPVVWALGPDGLLHPVSGGRIQMQSAFSKKPFEVAAYLREGVTNLEGKISTNKTSSMGTLPEALALRRSSKKVGMSATATGAQELLIADIGSRVVAIDAPPARGNRSRTYLALEDSNVVPSITERILESHRLGRGVICYDEAYGRLIQEAIISRGLGGKVIEVTQTTPDIEITGGMKNGAYLKGLKDIIADERLIVFTNERILRGIHIKGDNDIMINLDTLNAQKRLQAEGRVAREQGSAGEVFAYYTSGAKAYLERVFASAAIYDLLRTRWNADEVTENLSTLASKFKASQRLGDEDFIRLYTETISALDKSKAVWEKVESALDSVYINDFLTTLQREARTASQRQAIQEARERYLNGEDHIGEDAVSAIRYEDPLKDFKRLHESKITQAGAVLWPLRRAMASNRFTAARNKTVIEKIQRHLEELQAVNIEAIGPSPDSDFSVAENAKETAAV
ncbi:MAG: hypothetical protein AABZ44_08145, partial [Elusimicrobiota bacterium]